MSWTGYQKSQFCLKQGRKISDICLKQGQSMRGRAAPPHPRIYRETPPPPDVMANCCIDKSRLRYKPFCRDFSVIYPKLEIQYIYIEYGYLWSVSVYVRSGNLDPRKKIPCHSFCSSGEIIFGLLLSQARVSYHIEMLGPEMSIKTFV